MEAQVDAQDLAEFGRLGVPAQELQAAAAQRAQAEAAQPVEAEEDVKLAAHLWPAVQLAAALRTQRRMVTNAVSGLQQVLGLDYARYDGCKRDMSLPMRGPRSLALFRQFQVVEDEMLKVWNGRMAQGSA